MEVVRIYVWYDRLTGVGFGRKCFDVAGFCGTPAQQPTDLQPITGCKYTLYTLSTAPAITYDNDDDDEDVGHDDDNNMISCLGIEDDDGDGDDDDDDSIDNEHVDENDGNTFRYCSVNPFFVDSLAIKTIMMIVMTTLSIDVMWCNGGIQFSHLWAQYNRMQPNIAPPSSASPRDIDIGVRPSTQPNGAIDTPYRRVAGLVST